MRPLWPCQAVFEGQGEAIASKSSSRPEDRWTLGTEVSCPETVNVPDGVEVLLERGAHKKLDVVQGNCSEGSWWLRRGWGSLRVRDGWLGCSTCGARLWRRMRVRDLRGAGGVGGDTMRRISENDAANRDGTTDAHLHRWVLRHWWQAEAGLAEL